MLSVPRPSLASSLCSGERGMKDTDHYRVHPVVHSANHRSMKEENSLETAEHTAWARRGDRIGLERPHCLARGRAQRDSWGRSSPTEMLMPLDADAV